MFLNDALGYHVIRLLAESTCNKLQLSYHKKNTENIGVTNKGNL